MYNRNIQEYCIQYTVQRVKYQDFVKILSKFVKKIKNIFKSFEK